MKLIESSNIWKAVGEEFDCIHISEMQHLPLFGILITQTEQIIFAEKLGVEDRFSHINSIEIAASTLVGLVIVVFDAQRSSQAKDASSNYFFFLGRCHCKAQRLFLRDPLFLVVGASSARLASVATV